MGYIRKTPRTLGASEPIRDDVNDAPVNPKGPMRGPRGTHQINPRNVRTTEAEWQMTEDESGSNT